MKIFVLTHQRELFRKTNTASIAYKEKSQNIKRIMYHRLSPNNQLIDAIQQSTTVCLYPTEDSKLLTDVDFQNIIIIDATWQEARKMYNHSPYLKNINKVHIKTTNVSRYQLRKNQPQGGLCTIECIIEILKLKHNNSLAKKLETSYKVFNNPKII